MRGATVHYGRMKIRRVTIRVPRSGPKRFVVVGFLAATLIVSLIGAIYFTGLYFSCRKIIEEHLKSQKWALPSTIYADAPVIYEGMPIKEKWLVEYLQRLNYQKTENKKVSAGQYSIQEDGVSFFKHRLFPEQPGIFPVTIKFSDAGITSITNAGTAEDLAAYELEPAAISSLFGSEWEKRTLVHYQDLPPDLVKAVVAIEDRRFFQHHGVDFRAILRAVWNDLTGGKQLQGGSTITQQLAKNFYLSPERKLPRKIREAMMAWLMEGRITKEQILELYLNEIYLGQRGGISINGVGEASRLFFRKDVQLIDVPECALLAGLIQSPNTYNPYRHPKEAKQRRDTVLLAMKNTGKKGKKSFQLRQKPNRPFISTWTS